ncbi:MAG: chemotaxis protein CheW [Cyanobacteria bacterium P01_A01_bin.40]
MSSLTTTERLKGLLPQLFNEQKREGNYYLRFQLTHDIDVLLDLRYVQESLTIDSSQITSVPNLPEYVVGMMTSRNKVFLSLDLAHLAGFPAQTINLRQYQTIVVQINSGKNNNVQSEEANFYGLTVRRIQGISRILPEQFDASTTMAPDILRPFIQGSVQNSSENEHSNFAESNRSYLLDLSRLITAQIQS